MSSLDKTGLAYFFSKISQIFCKKDDCYNKLESDNKYSSKSTLVTVEVKAENWVGDLAPFSQNINVVGVTQNSINEILPEANVSNSVFTMIKNADIEDGGQADNTITLLAFGTKPISNFNIRIIIRGDM